MKFLITGGGTGGHIYPALAIAKKIKSEFKDAKILYVGTNRGLEKEVVPKHGFEFTTIRVKGFRRKLSLDTIKTIKELFLGLNDAKKVIKEFSPDIVIGTGGYVCGPVVLISSLKGIPTLIHEQNAYPGVTNRILSRFVNKIAISFEDSKKYFKDNNKLILTGNPIRDEFIYLTKETAYQRLNLDKNKKFVLSFGGSGGQKSLNNAMRYVIKNNNKVDSKIQILHITGKMHYERFMKNLENDGVNKLLPNIQIVPYFYKMPEGLKTADLVITSAGAITLSELTAVGVPSILIPKGYTTENHQEYNAKALQKNGASVMILEKELDGEKLNEKINSILLDKNKLSEMAIQSKSMGRTDSTDRIIRIIKDII